MKRYFVSFLLLLTLVCVTPESMAAQEKTVLGVKIAWYAITAGIKGKKKDKSWKGFVKGMAIGAFNGSCAWSGQKLRSRVAPPFGLDENSSRPAFHFRKTTFAEKVSSMNTERTLDLSNGDITLKTVDCSGLKFSLEPQ